LFPGAAKERPAGLDPSRRIANIGSRCTNLACSGYNATILIFSCLVLRCDNCAWKNNKHIPQYRRYDPAPHLNPPTVDTPIQTYSPITLHYTIQSNPDLRCSCSYLPYPIPVTIPRPITQPFIFPPPSISHPPSLYSQDPAANRLYYAGIAGSFIGLVRSSQLVEMCWVPGKCARVMRGM
jgi:hypothetical protein